MAWFCSWNRSFRRADPFMNLSTQRRTQPSSRLIRDLVVKSLTQSSKQRWTSLEYIYNDQVRIRKAELGMINGRMGRWTGGWTEGQMNC